MKFLEYKAKEIFARYGIPVPRGTVASSPEDISDPPLPCMVKAQVLVGSRGKAGGIKAAESLDEARAVSRQILGMDIETVLRDQIFMEHVPTMAGLQPYVLRTMLSFLGLPKETGGQVADIVRRSYELFRKEDAELVEINPLAVTRDGRVIAGDAKLVIDDNAEYRHSEYANLDQDRTPLEQEAHEKGITFIQLDGDIGVIANGDGLTMATLDVLNLKGGRGGTFLDLGGTDDSEKVKQAFEILIKANPSAILLNIFGGITKADTVALGVQQALEDMHTRIPVVARIKGVNEDRAKEILRSIGMYATETMEEAAELAVKVKSGGS